MLDLRNAFAVGSRTRRCHATASIGVSVIVDPAQDLAKLITLADQALSILCLSHFRTENRFPLFLKMLRLAKARGRNRVEVAPLEVSLGGELPQHPSMIHAPEQSGRSHTG